MKVLKIIFRLLLGATFIFSGVVKGIDPWGSAYKFTDYLEAFNMPFLTAISLPLAFVLSYAEFIIGIGLLFNLLTKKMAGFALLFMLFFTPLTLYIALKNPVSDCGCFGDALKISNWETFYKNLILIFAAIVTYINRNNFKAKLRSGFQWFIILIFTIGFGLFEYHNLSHLPIIDFRPFAEGVNITEAMKIPDDAPKPVYENVFHYKNRKSGLVEKFTENNYPWKDTINWEFVKMDEPKLVSEGYKPPIDNFSIETTEGDDVKSFFLEDDNFTFFFISYDLKKASGKNMQKIKTLSDHIMHKEYNIIGLTAGVAKEIEAFKKQHYLHFDFLFTDPITLKTIVRANPGLVLLKKGTIIRKWHYNDVPTIDELDTLLSSY